MADRRPPSLRKKLLFAAVAVAAVLALVEGALALVGVRPVVATEDTSQGFSGLVSIYERQGERYRTRGAEVRKTFNDQSFLVEKPEKGFRFFVLGGSSAYGYPWGADVAFGALVAEVAAAAHPELTVEGVNAAGISYAMHRLNIVADEVLRYRPDALVVYSGHNEFVEPGFYRELRERGETFNRVEYLAGHSRIYSALYRARRRAASRARSGDDALDVTVRRESIPFTYDEKHEVVRSFRAGLERLVEKAQAAGVEVAILPVPANLRDWKPDRSETLELDDDARERWTAARLEGERLLEAGDAAAAVERLEAAQKLAPRHAHTWYLLARAYEAVGRYDDARRGYAAACDLDLSPVRRTTGINAAARAVATRHGALLVDADRFFEEQAENGLVGFDLIEDYVHPNRRGHELIAWQLWNAIEDAGWLGTPTPRAERDERFRTMLAGRSAGEGERENVVWLVNQGVILRNQGRDELAAEKYRQALEIDPDYTGALWNLGALTAEREDWEASAALLERLLENDPGHAEARVKYAEVLARLGRGADALAQLGAGGDESGAPDAKQLNNQGTVYEQAGDAVKARELFERAVAADPSYAIARANLGKLLLEAGETEAARSHLEEALRLQPDSARAHYNLGFLHARAGDLETACPLFDRAVELDDGYTRAHYNRGLCLLGRRDLAGARGAFERVLELSPDDGNAHNQMGMILASQGDLAGAETHFVRAVELRPDDPGPRSNLQRLRSMTGR